MRAAKYFDVVWYRETTTRHRIVLDNIIALNDKVSELMKDETVSSFYVQTHTQMPKQV